MLSGTVTLLVDQIARPGIEQPAVEADPAGRGRRPRAMRQALRPAQHRLSGASSSRGANGLVT
ncbi:MAG: hypothetical protein R3D28_21300 [Geminicoccaceae bacterium]